MVTDIVLIQLHVLMVERTSTKRAFFFCAPLSKKGLVD